jgi:hypothetical protein
LGPYGFLPPHRIAFVFKPSAEQPIALKKASGVNPRIETIATHLN